MKRTLLLKQSGFSPVIILFLAGWHLSSAFLISAQTNQSWTLRQTMEYVTVNNPDVRITEQRILAAQAGLSQANAALRKALGLSQLEKHSTEK